MKNIVIQYILKRLLEASTLRGIILSVGAVIGFHFSDRQTDDIIYIVLGLVGIVGSLLPDNIGKSISDAAHDQTKSLTPEQEEEENKVDEPPEQGWGDK